MAKTVEVYVHVEGAGPKLLKIDENATLLQLLIEAKNAGLIDSNEDQGLKIFLEDSEEEQNRHHPLCECSIKHKSHVHCHRCHQVSVEVVYNGVSKARSFAPSATGTKIKKWALGEFGLKGPDAADKVLRLENEEELGADVHIGTYTRYPKCEVKLFLTALVEVQG